MDLWFELEIETAHGWGVVMPPMLRVHGGSVEPTNARRYATAADAHAGAAKYGSSKPHYRVYLCSAATRTPVED